jgi:Cd2+/Zn2+-exporting ATPase
MGAGGTAQALETADVALMADDLTQLPVAIKQGHRSARIIQFNIWFALIIKAVFLLLAISGMATLWMAVFADMGASLLVTLNGMRLLKIKENTPQPR